MHKKSNDEAGDEESGGDAEEWRSVLLRGHGMERAKKDCNNGTGPGEKRKGLTHCENQLLTCGDRLFEPL